MRFVLRSERHLADLRAALPRLLADLPSARVVTVNLHPEHKAVLEGDTEVVLTEQTLLPVRVGDVTLLLGPKSFFQTNTERGRGALPAGPELGRRAPTRPSVWDLYCGVGGFALHATGPGRTVVGVETSAEAVDGRRASARLHTDAVARHPRRARFEVGDATTPPSPPHPDLVVVNPPRRGIGPELAALARGVGPAPRRLLQLQRRRRWPATSRRCRRCARSTAGCSTCSRRPGTPR